MGRVWRRGNVPNPETNWTITSEESQSQSRTDRGHAENRILKRSIIQFCDVFLFRAADRDRQCLFWMTIESKLFLLQFLASKTKQNLEEVRRISNRQIFRGHGRRRCHRQGCRGRPLIAQSSRRRRLCRGRVRCQTRAKFEHVCSSRESRRTESEKRNLDHCFCECRLAFAFASRPSLLSDVAATESTYYPPASPNRGFFSLGRQTNRLDFLTNHANCIHCLGGGDDTAPKLE